MGHGADVALTSVIGLDRRAEPVDPLLVIGDPDAVDIKYVGIKA